MIWTRPKQIGPVQNYWYSTKMVWTVQNRFGPIEGQGIKQNQKSEKKDFDIIQEVLKMNYITRYF